MSDKSNLEALLAESERRIRHIFWRWGFPIMSVERQFQKECAENCDHE